MKIFRFNSIQSIILTIFVSFAFYDLSLAKEKKDLENKSALQIDSFFDLKADYAHFSGRVTDKDDSGMLFKVTSENKNTRFF